MTRRSAHLMSSICSVQNAECVIHGKKSSISTKAKSLDDGIICSSKVGILGSKWHPYRWRLVSLMVPLRHRYQLNIECSLRQGGRRDDWGNPSMLVRNKFLQYYRPFKLYFISKISINSKWRDIPNCPPRLCHVPRFIFGYGKGVNQCHPIITTKKFARISPIFDSLETGVFTIG